MIRPNRPDFGALRALLHANEIDYQTLLEMMECLYLEDSIEYTERWMPYIEGVLCSRGIERFIITSPDALELAGALVPMGVFVQLDIADEH